jgi:hypothetical protein
MKKLIIIIGIAAMVFAAKAQTKTDTSNNTHPDRLNNTIKHNKMKDYVFILRLKAITPEIIAQVGLKWAELVPKWAAQGHFAGNSVMVNEGHLISGKGRIMVNEPVRSDGLIVLDVFRIKAESLEEALELAKQCPTLDAGGTVEVREVQPTPEVPHN